VLQVLYLITGTLLGTTAGLLPGLHTNNIAPAIVALPIMNPNLFIFTAATASAFTVSSTVPSVLLGAPSGENIAVLPGHKLTNQGKGMTAIHLTLKGTLTSIILTPIIAIYFTLLAPSLYGHLAKLFPVILVTITLLVINKPQAAPIAILSAALGLTTLSNSTIMPMLTGFFGTSTLIVALAKGKRKTIQTKKNKPRKKGWQTTRPAVASTIISTFMGTIPAVSTAVTAVIGKALGKMDEEEYLSFIGASNTTYMTISFLTLLYLGKTRTGTTAAIATTQFPFNTLMTIATLMASASIAYAVVKTSTPKIINFMNRKNHKKITITALIFLLTVNILLTNITGLAVLVTATAIGIATVKLRVSRINCMASLTIPTALLLI